MNHRNDFKTNHFKEDQKPKRWTHFWFTSFKASWKWNSTISPQSRFALTKSVFPPWFTLGRAVCGAALLHVSKCLKQLPQSACFGTGSLRSFYTPCAMGTSGISKPCEHASCVRVYVCVCWANSHHTGAGVPSTSNPRHHLHRPFPACRVTPAPALPPLPSHTYQPPAAVPLPEAGSSSPHTADKRQTTAHPYHSQSVSHWVLLSKFFSFPFLPSWISFRVPCFQGLCDYNLKARWH